MYNLNYTYLSDLNIDTSRSARDISASAMFVSISDNDYTTPVSSITNRFVDWFFAATNPNIPLLDITLHNAFLRDRPLSNYGPTSVRTYTEVTSAISAQLTSLFNTIQTKLQATISTLNLSNVIPVGTVIINKTAPTPGSWTEVSGRFIQEATTDTGTIPSTNVNLSACTIFSTGVTPAHTHEVKLTPSSKDSTANISAEATGLGAFPTGGWLAIKNEHVGQSGDLNALAIAAWDGWDANNKLDGEKAAIKQAYNNMISVAPAGGASVTKTINVAPQISQITASIFIKTS